MYENNNNFQQQQPQQKEIKDLKIELEEPIQLNPPIQNIIETTNKICVEILKKLTPVFPDLIGAMLQVGQKGDIELSLTFEKKGHGNVVDLFNNADLNSRIGAFNTVNSTNRTFDLDDTVKGFFQRFLIKSNSNNKIDWNQYINQVSVNANMAGGKHTVLVLSHISFDRILPEFLFVNEETSSRKNTTQFKSVITGPTTPTPMCKNWFIKIDILEQATVDYIAKEAGVVTSTYGLDMVTI